MSDAPTTPSERQRNPRRPRVVVADVQPLYREAVARAVRQRPTLELVGEAADGRSALTAIVERRPEVAVIDIHLPELDGPRVLNAVGRDRLPTRIVFLSAHIDAALAYKLLGAGAAGYLSKEATADEICDALAAVARGDTVLAPQIQTGLAGEIRLRAHDEKPLLTDRELDVIKLVAAGQSAPEIGRTLHLSTATVKTHLLRLYDKFGASERAEAVAEAMRRGLIE
jgi:two-component system nitrate/nitrite response regulator NarL